VYKLSEHAFSSLVPKIVLESSSVGWYHWNNKLVILLDSAHKFSKNLTTLNSWSQKGEMKVPAEDS